MILNERSGDQLVFFLKKYKGLELLNLEIKFSYVEALTVKI